MVHIKKKKNRVHILKQSDYSSHCQAPWQVGLSTVLMNHDLWKGTLFSFSSILWFIQHTYTKHLQYA